MLTKEQIERFFSYKCSPAEADAVARFLEQHPEVLDTYLNDKEWEEFRFENGLDRQKAALILQEIKNKTVGPDPRRISPIAYFTAAAAILVAGFFLLQWLYPGKAVMHEGAQYQSRLITNSNNEVMMVMLPDSSVVQLTPGSSVGYPEPFQDGLRRIELKGEALFEVRKNPKMPFIVATYPLSTTVLGTVFSVRSFEKEQHIKITLFKGFIAVGNSDSLRPAVATPYYMSPGDVLIYNKTTGRIRFSPAGIPEAKSKKPDMIKKPGNTIEGNNWYMFNNQPLSGVFDQLALLYDLPIRYTKEDLKGLSFIGKIDKTDTLETVLNLIGRLNNLQVTRMPDGYIIKKIR